VLVIRCHREHVWKWLRPILSTTSLAVCAGDSVTECDDCWRTDRYRRSDCYWQTDCHRRTDCNEEQMIWRWRGCTWRRYRAFVIFFSSIRLKILSLDICSFSSLLAVNLDNERDHLSSRSANVSPIPLIWPLQTPSLVTLFTLLSIVRFIFSGARGNRSLLLGHNDSLNSVVFHKIMSTSLLLGSAVQVIAVAHTAGDGDNETLSTLMLKCLHTRNTDCKYSYTAEVTMEVMEWFNFRLPVVTNSLRRSKLYADQFWHRHPTSGNGSCKFGIFFIFIFVCIISNTYL